jgi:hypothetical protein
MAVASKPYLAENPADRRGRGDKISASLVAANRSRIVFASRADRFLIFGFLVGASDSDMGTSRMFREGAYVGSVSGSG